MKFNVVIVITVFCLINVSFAPSFAGEKTKILEKLSKKYSLNLNNLSLDVIKLTSPIEKIESINSNKMRIPASITKLVTAAAVLEKFPQGHQFVTTLQTNGVIKGQHLNGDIYIKGDGDPTFTSESMWVLVNNFFRSGITSIQGDIVVDASKFDNIHYDPGRDPNRVDRAYDSPISAMVFNWSAMNVYVRPTKVNEKPEIFLDPQSDYGTILNKAKTVENSQSKYNIKVKRVKTKNSDKFVITGKIGVNDEEVVKFKGITKPTIWVGENLRAFLKRRGILVKGKVKEGKVPLGSKVLAEYKSKHLDDIVKAMMKYSNNFIAEILTKNMGALVHQPASMEDGIKVIEEFLVEKVKVNKKDFNISSPSGLSRKNKFKAHDIVRLLQYMKTNFKTYPEFIAAQPIAGVDGTLKNRFKNHNGSIGRVRAKTGRLGGVVGFSGFGNTREGDEFIFCYFYNGKLAKMNNAINFIDDYLSEISHR